MAAASGFSCIAPLGGKRKSYSPLFPASITSFIHMVRYRKSGVVNHQPALFYYDQGQTGHLPGFYPA